MALLCFIGDQLLVSSFPLCLLEIPPDEADSIKPLDTGLPFDPSMLAAIATSVRG